MGALFPHHAGPLMCESRRSREFPASLPSGRDDAPSSARRVMKRRLPRRRAHGSERNNSRQHGEKTVINSKAVTELKNQFRLQRRRATHYHAASSIAGCRPHRRHAECVVAAHKVTALAQDPDPSLGAPPAGGHDCAAIAPTLTANAPAATVAVAAPIGSPIAATAIALAAAALAAAALALAAATAPFAATITTAAIASGETNAACTCIS